MLANTSDVSCAACCEKTSPTLELQKKTVGLVYDKENVFCLEKNWLRDEAESIELDLGCGNSTLMHSLALADPKTKFIGVDREHRRCLRGERIRRVRRIENVAFVNMEAHLFIRNHVRSNSVRNVYILFPSPFPLCKRLATRKFFIDLYRILEPGGEFRLITDEDSYFLFARRGVDGNIWKEIAWKELPVAIPDGMLVGTPCELEYGSKFVLRAIK